ERCTVARRHGDDGGTRDRSLLQAVDRDAVRVRVHRPPPHTVRTADPVLTRRRGHRMGLRGEAAIVGFTELPATRQPTGPLEFNLEQWARLAAAALADAGLTAADVDGIVTTHLPESQLFAPSTIIEYLGITANFAELVDLGGASSAAMVWRAAAAIELGLCSAVLCVVPAIPLTPTCLENQVDFTEMLYFGASSNRYVPPQAE